MSHKLRGIAAALGLFLAAALSVNTTEARAGGCENQQCLRLCSGGTCVEDCFDWSEWQCAGGSGWCVSVWCPIEPE